jgi:hypothetical protein
MSTGQLGTIVSWKVPAEVPLSTLRDGLAAAGLDTSLAADLAPRNALSRAMREMNKNRVIRKLRMNGDVLTFQINQVVQAGQHIEYPHETDVDLNTTTGVVYSSDPVVEADAKRLLQEHLDKRLTSDLTRLVQRVFDSKRADLIPIREQGGAYFVPDAQSELVDAMRTLLQHIGGNLRSFAIRLGSDDTSESVAESLAEYMSSLLTDFRESVESLDTDTRKDVYERRATSIAEMRAKMECYGALLGQFSTALSEQVKEADELLLKKMLEKSAAVNAEPAQAATAA